MYEVCWFSSLYVYIKYISDWIKWNVFSVQQTNRPLTQHQYIVQCVVLKQVHCTACCTKISTLYRVVYYRTSTLYSVLFYKFTMYREDHYTSMENKTGLEAFKDTYNFVMTDLRYLFYHLINYLKCLVDNNLFKVYQIW